MELSQAPHERTQAKKSAWTDKQQTAMPDEFARACQIATLLDPRLNLKLRRHELATHSVHFDTFCYQLSCKLIFQVDNNIQQN